MEQGQVLLNTGPRLVDQLENILARLKTSDKQDDPFSGIGIVDARDHDSPTESLEPLDLIRQSIRELEVIREVALQISEAASLCATAAKNKAVGLGLQSLPAELLQDILYLSVLRDVGLWCPVDVHRVLVLQSVSRYFRDVVQGTQLFWLYPSSKNVPLLEVMLRRSKGCSLHLYIGASDLTSAWFCEVLKVHAHRWQSLHIDQLQLEKLDVVLDMITSPTFCNLRSLAIVYNQFCMGIEDINSISTSLPNLTELHLLNCILPNSVATSLTTLSISIDVLANWSAATIVSLITSQRSLETLDLSIGDKVEVPGMFTSSAQRHFSPIEDRGIHVALRFHRWSSIAALSLIWHTISNIGINSMTLDLSKVNWTLHDFSFCRVLHYACAAPTLTALIILLPSTSGNVELRGVEDHLEDDTEFPLSLVDLAVHNCSPAVRHMLCPKIDRLICRQEIHGLPLMQNVVFAGRPPSSADRVPFLAI